MANEVAVLRELIWKLHINGMLSVEHREKLLARLDAPQADPPAELRQRMAANANIPDRYLFAQYHSQDHIESRWMCKTFGCVPLEPAKPEPEKECNCRGCNPANWPDTNGWKCSKWTNPQPPDETAGEPVAAQPMRWVVTQAELGEGSEFQLVYYSGDREPVSTVPVWVRELQPLTDAELERLVKAFQDATAHLSSIRTRSSYFKAGIRAVHAAITGGGR